MAEPTVSLQVVVSHWQTDAVGIAGMALEGTAAVVYLWGALVLRRRHRPWPVARTVPFLLGLITIAVALQSGFGGYDDSVFWAHMVQHLAIMMLAPPLLCLGAPVTLALRVVGPGGRRRILGLLRDPNLKPLDSRAAVVLLPLDYYGSMFVYLLTPIYRASEAHPWLHDFVHVYFLLCGLFFWLPLIGADPVRWRPKHETKVALVAIGIPLYALLTALTLGRAQHITTALSADSIRFGLWIMLAFSAALSLGGMVLLEARRRARQRARNRLRQHYEEIRLGPGDFMIP